ncbi:DUF2946 family protein [Janthinobacterium sp. 17J80-10]|uniref:DUF2946 family protein n=1 Tax=Janthinobacterium sp. 17J80-10 TaxID=2497863 RepID=UPI00100551D5|nr:DUF2946 family protein [Janthinobacterium sp. 17J80-10]QAU33643.1 DUF2946 family protein [Janthinobacterium sp. 17J80-10]
MDEIVKQAMAKWPNVPHCYGWLALDARGGWRMRNEQAQALQQAGERIANAALLGFINRNYTHDGQGRWYFQNGPQRVYVSLQATPYIVRTDPQAGFILHTGAALERIDAVWMNEDGALILECGEIVAQVDDRDMAQCLPYLECNNRPLGDDELLAWLEADAGTPELRLRYGEQVLPVQRIRPESIEMQFHFIRAPRPEIA